MRATADSEHPFASCEVMRSHYGPLVQMRGAVTVLIHLVSSLLKALFDPLESRALHSPPQLRL